MTQGPVVLTLSPGTFPGLAESLSGLPATVEELPLLTFAPPADWTPVDAAIRELSRYDALAFTSPRAATAFAERWRKVVGSGRTLGDGPPTVWSGGPGTTAALKPLAGAVRTASDEEAGRLGAAAALAASMLEAGVGGPVLFPCGDTRREELPTRLRQSGIEVNEVVCYRSVLAGEASAREAAARAAILVVGSPSVAELLARASSRDGRPLMLAIGPTTAAAARASGWAPAAVATVPRVEALVDGVRSLLADRESPR